LLRISGRISTFFESGADRNSILRHDHDSRAGANSAAALDLTATQQACVTEHALAVKEIPPNALSEM
jgi:cytochrome c551/c552